MSHIMLTVNCENIALANKLRDFASKNSIPVFDIIKQCPPKEVIATSNTKSNFSISRVRKSFRSSGAAGKHLSDNTRNAIKFELLNGESVANISKFYNVTLSAVDRQQKVINRSRMDRDKLCSSIKNDLYNALEGITVKPTTLSRVLTNTQRKEIRDIYMRGDVVSAYCEQNNIFKKTAYNFISHNKNKW